jgi:hypothetical protein
VRKKMQTSLEEMRKDIDILMDNLLVVENLNKEGVTMQHETHLKVFYYPITPYY